MCDGGMFSLREVTASRPSEQPVVGDIVDIGTWWVGWHVIVSCVRISSGRHWSAGLVATRPSWHDYPRTNAPISAPCSRLPVDDLWLQGWPSLLAMCLFKRLNPRRKYHTATSCHFSPAKFSRISQLCPPQACPLHRILSTTTNRWRHFDACTGREIINIVKTWKGDFLRHDSHPMEGRQASRLGCDSGLHLRWFWCGGFP